MTILILILSIILISCNIQITPIINSDLSNQSLPVHVVYIETKDDALNFAKEWLKNHTANIENCKKCDILGGIYESDNAWEVEFTCGTCRLIFLKNLSDINFYCPEYVPTSFGSIIIRTFPNVSCQINSDCKNTGDVQNSTRRCNEKQICQEIYPETPLPHNRTTPCII